MSEKWPQTAYCRQFQLSRSEVKFTHFYSTYETNSTAVWNSIKVSAAVFKLQYNQIFLSKNSSQKVKVKCTKS